MAWRVVDVHGADTSADRDTVEAALVSIERDGEERRIYVEFAGTAKAAGRSFNARTAVHDYLDDEDPPKHLIVTTTGVYPPE
jgi:N-methylhydantoinase B/oxoprolinase/acetone carboxylase alpha subunit